jgi:glycosyltransferase involved in cell wall biosynthesis
MSDGSRDTSVVICAYTMDRWSDIVAAVDSVRHQGPGPREIILVIDHNDALLRRAQSELPASRVLANAGARGLSGARNTGVEAAVGEIVAFLDDDAAGEEGWLRALVDPFADPRVVGTGGGAEPLWTVPRPPWFPDEFGWVVGCSYRGLPVVRSPVRNPIGCNMAFRRAAILEAGGFRNEVGRVGTLPAGCEETELSIRLSQLRPHDRIVFEPAARVRHRVSADRNRWSYFRSRCYQEGRSKAMVSRLRGRRSGLSSEFRYTLVVLPIGIGRGLKAVVGGDPWGMARAAAIVLGLVFTTIGYLAAGLQLRRAARSPERSRSAPTGGRSEGDPMTSGARERQAPIKVIDLEISEPIVDVPSDRGADPPARSLRAIVRLHGVPIGLVDAPFDDAFVTGDALARLVARDLTDAISSHLREDGSDTETAPVAPAMAPAVDGGLPAVLWTSVREGSGAVPTCHVRPRIESEPPGLSIVIPTRDRPERVLACIRSAIATGYPALEILVVDNAPSSDATEEAIAGAGLDGVSYLREPRAGTSRARNLGLYEAGGGLIAFLDDDVLVDRAWAAALVRGFASDPRVDCVTGPIVAAELETEAQVLIEEYGGFDKGFARRVLDPAAPPAGAPLFPYTAGTLGSGANMAFRREAIVALGGFDVALGGGTASRGGEDLAAFLGILLSGSKLAYEPSMLVRHYHHRRYSKLRRVLLGYGMGLGAYLTRTVVVDPRQLLAIAQRLPRGVAYLFDPHSAKNAKRRSDYPRQLTVRELLGLSVGPFAYLIARSRAGRPDPDRTERDGKPR